MAEMWYGSTPDMGLQLAELAGALSGNLMRQVERIKELRDAGTLDELTTAQVYADVAEQNADLATMFEQRFRSQGKTAEAALAAQWATDERARLERMRAAIELGDKVELGKTALTYGTELTGIGEELGVKGAEGLGKLFGNVGKVITVNDVIVAASEGDGRELAEIFTKVAVGALIGTAAKGLMAGAALVGSSLLVISVLAVSFSVMALGGDELVDQLFETIFGESPQDVQAALRESIVKFGQVNAPNLGYTLHFGSMEDDYLNGAQDQQNSMTGGGGDDTLYGGKLDDYISGGSGNDLLRGEGGDDRLRGGIGDDFLEGGLGRDTLEGGEGMDTYRFFSAELTKGGEDIIVDSDGRGVIYIDHYAIATGSLHRALGPATWDTADGKLRIIFSSGNLILRHADTGARIIISNWKEGDFGITLPDLGQPGQPENPITFTNGDDLVGSDGQFEAPPFSGNDYFNGMGGNDAIDGGFGDDWIDGGVGNDLVLGGPGVNRLRGGGGNDVLLSAPMVVKWSNDFGLDAIDHDDPHLFSSGRGWEVRGDENLDRSDAGSLLLAFRPWATYSVTPGRPLNNWVRYLSPNVYAGQADDLLGGDGHDVVYGGEGDDVLEGGTGNDLLVGGADDDTIYGDDGNDLILGDELTVGDNMFATMATLLSSHARADGNDVIHGGYGDDRIFGLGGADTITGGDGNDILQGDRFDYAFNASYELNTIAGNDFIDGGAGNDKIYGDGGHDTLFGGTGDDYLLGDSVANHGADHGRDMLDGGDGNDVLFGMGGSDELYGGDGDDELVGDGADANVSSVYHGDDRLYGGAGLDKLIGNGGNDLLDGGDDDDSLWGGEGNDVLLGGRGNDQLIGDAGNDTLDAGAGDDRLWGEAGDDVLDGGVGNDILQAGDGNDSARGGDGHDELLGGTGRDFLDGGAGDDKLFGGEGADTLYGSDGHDYLAGDGLDAGGAQGDDVLDGGRGNDTLVGGGGNDLLAGDVGDDYLFGDLPGTDLVGNDRLDGGTGNDYLDGGAGNDDLRGGGGDDTLVGGAGDDVLVGGSGNDVMDGGLGQNRFEFAADFGEDIIEAKAADGAGHVYAFSGDIDRDRVRFIKGQGFDLIVRIEGTDDSVLIQNFFKADGTDTFEFGDGSTLTAEEVAALTEGGNGGGNGAGGPINGGEDGDVLTGGEGNDVLLGGGGDDALQGLGGNDRRVGGSGDDILGGGAGNDVYEFGIGFGFDRITGLELATAGSDIIRFTSGSGYTRAAASITRVGDSLTLGFSSPDGWNALELEGFLAAGNGSHVIEFADGSILRASDFGGGPVIGLPGQPSDGAGDGDDILRGGLGNDILDGGAGNDQIDGGAGDDVVRGADGNDRLQGGAGNDQLYGGAGNDELDGGAGNDTLDGGSGNDTFRWGRGQGSDIIVSGDNLSQRDVRLQGLGSPQDLGFTREGYDLRLAFTDTGETLTIKGYFDPSLPSTRLAFEDGTPMQPTDLWSGDNHIVGGDLYEEDVLYGYGGNDRIDGRGGDDTLYGGTGDDKLDGNYGTDRLYGEDGNDTLYGDGEYTPDWWGGGGADYLDGGAGDDYLRGSSGADILLGGSGNDRLHGGQDDDLLIGGTGNDYLEGNTGSDTYRFSRGHGQDRVQELGVGLLDLNIIVYDSTISPDEISVRRSSLTGDDLVLDLLATGDSITISKFYQDLLPEGEARLTGIDGVRFADGTFWSIWDLAAMSMQGTERNDILRGLHVPGDVYDGRGGNDYVLALDHDDTLLGGSGNDALAGGAGNDVLDGGSGMDYLRGESGNDVYRFGRGSGVDFINNGDGAIEGYDVIALQSGVSADDVILRRSGDSLVIDIRGTDDRIVVIDHFRPATDTYPGGAVDALRFADGTEWAAVEFLTRLGDALPVLAVQIDDQWLTGNQGDGGYVLGIQQGGGSSIGGLNAGTWFDLGPAGSLPMDPTERRIEGGHAGDTYVFGRGYGKQDVYDAGGVDQVRFAHGIVADDVSIERIGDDLLLRLDANSVLRVHGHFDGAVGMESVIFGDGTRWDAAWLLAHAVLLDRTVTGGDDRDELQGDIGNDTLRGGAGDDVLVGGAGDDLLDGGVGADRMLGGAGDDTYVIDNAADEVIEPADRQEGDGEGSVDTVLTSIDYIAHKNIERVFLQGSADLNATGGEGPNVLVGNAGANILRGTALDVWSSADDWLDGGAGNDFLYGGWGSDTLLGGLGDDYMEGGGGADLYYVDSIGDIVVESDGDGGLSFAAVRMEMGVAGVQASVEDAWVSSVVGVHPARNEDTVVSTIDYALGSGIEDLVLRGGAVVGNGNALNNELFGNELSNRLYGHDGEDSLQGGGGDDVLEGGDGDDWLIGGAGGDMLNGGDGYDRYEWRVGDGHDVIINTDAWGEDAVAFSDLTLSEMRVSRADDDLVVATADGTGSVRIQDWYSDSNNRVDWFTDRDGNEWSADGMEAIAAGGPLPGSEGALLVQSLARAADSPGQAFTSTPSSTHSAQLLYSLAAL